MKVFPEKRRKQPMNVVVHLRDREKRSRKTSPHSKLLHFVDNATAVSSFDNNHILNGGGLRSTFMIVFSHDRSLIASSHGNHKIKICRLSSLECIQTLGGHPRSVWSLSFHPSSNDLLASGCLGGQVRVWDLQGRSEIWNCDKSTTITSLSFHPHERLLAIATGNQVLLWDWSHPAPFLSVEAPAADEYIRLIRFDHHGHHLLTGITNTDSRRSWFDGIHYGSRQNIPHSTSRGSDNDDDDGEVPMESDVIPEPSMPDSPPDGLSINRQRPGAITSSQSSARTGGRLSSNEGSIAVSEPSTNRNPPSQALSTSQHDPHSPASDVLSNQRTEQTGDYALSSTSTGGLSPDQQSDHDDADRVVTNQNEGYVARVGSLANGRRDEVRQETSDLMDVSGEVLRDRDIPNRASASSEIESNQILQSPSNQFLAPVGTREVVLNSYGIVRNQSDSNKATSNEISNHEAGPSTRERGRGDEMEESSSDSRDSRSDEHNTMNPPMATTPEVPGEGNKMEGTSSSSRENRESGLRNDGRGVDHPASMVDTPPEPGNASEMAGTMSNLRESGEPPSSTNHRGGVDNPTMMTGALEGGPLSSRLHGPSSRNGFLISTQSGVARPQRRTPSRVVRVQRQYDGPELVQVRVISEQFQGSEGRPRRLTAEDLSQAVIIRTEETFHIPDLPDSLRGSGESPVAAAARALLFDSDNSNDGTEPPAQPPPPPGEQSPSDDRSPFTGLPIGSSLLDHIPNRGERVEQQVTYPVSGGDGMVGHVTVTRSTPADSSILRALQLQRNSGSALNSTSRRTHGARRILPTQLSSGAGGRRGSRNPRDEEGSGPSEVTRRSRLSRFGFARTAFRRRSGRRRQTQTVEDDPPIVPQGENRNFINQALADAFRGRWSNPAVANNINSVTHRLQWWDFKGRTLPDISDAHASVLVHRCKLYSDASCDISSDGRFLVTFVPYTFPDQFMVAAYSLERHNFGTVLFSKKLGAEAITLSISPSSSHVLVGLATSNIRCPAMPAPMAMICKLSNPSGKEGSMELEQVVNHTTEGQPSQPTGLNIAKWVPSVGAGFVYGTIKGDLRICKPRYDISRTKSSVNDDKTNHTGSGGYERYSLRSNASNAPHSLRRGQSTQTRRRTHSAGTQTDLTSRLIRRRRLNPPSEAASGPISSRLAINMADTFNNWSPAGGSNADSTNPTAATNNFFSLTQPTSGAMQDAVMGGGTGSSESSSDQLNQSAAASDTIQRMPRVDSDNLASHPTPAHVGSSNSASETMQSLSSVNGAPSVEGAETCDTESTDFNKSSGSVPSGSGLTERHLSGHTCDHQNSETDSLNRVSSTSESNANTADLSSSGTLDCNNAAAVSRPHHSSMGAIDSTETAAPSGSAPYLNVSDEYQQIPDCIISDGQGSRTVARRNVQNDDRVAGSISRHSQVNPISLIQSGESTSRSSQVDSSGGMVSLSAVSSSDQLMLDPTAATGVSSSDSSFSLPESSGLLTSSDSS